MAAILPTVPVLAMPPVNDMNNSRSVSCLQPADAERKLGSPARKRTETTDPQMAGATEGPLHLIHTRHPSRHIDNEEEGHRGIRDADELYAEYKEPLYAAPPLLHPRPGQWRGGLLKPVSARCLIACTAPRGRHSWRECRRRLVHGVGAVSWQVCGHQLTHRSPSALIGAADQPERRLALVAQFWFPSPLSVHALAHGPEEPLHQAATRVIEAAAALDERHESVLNAVQRAQRSRTRCCAQLSRTSETAWPSRTGHTASSSSPCPPTAGFFPRPSLINKRATRATGRARRRGPTGTTSGPSPGRAGW